MARLLRFVACALTVCALPAPVALADPPDVAATISGTLERTHVDREAGSTPITVLSTADGPQVVTFAADQPVPPNGAEVDLRGRLEGSTFVANEATITGPTLAIPASGSGLGPQAAAQQGTPLAAGTPRSVAIVVITFSNGYVPSYTDVALQNVLTANGNSVSNYFDEQSYGAVSFRGLDTPAGDVYRVSIASNGSGCASNAWQTWGSQAAAAVGSPTISRYDNVIYVFNSHGGCGWAGLAWMPGDEAYIDNAFTLSVVAHELGHNLGVHHAASLRCSSGGVAVSFTSANNACVPAEYGDPFDIMGSSATNHQSAFHKLQSGWLGSASGPRVQTITASGDYIVRPLESPSGVSLLLVPHVTAGSVSDPNTTLGSTFALDFRQPTGSYFDAFTANPSAVGGVQIRLVQTPGGSARQTELIDANPGTSTFADATLAQDATFTDTTDGITIKTIDVTPLGATVRVSFGSTGGSTGGGSGAIPPDTSAPTSVTGLTATVASGPVATLSFAPATDDRAVQSYRIMRDGLQIDSLAAATTSYSDWSTSYGPHVYGVIAVDTSANAGPSASVSVLVAAPAPAKPGTSVTPTTPTAPPTGTPGTTLDNSPAPSKPGTDGGSKPKAHVALKLTTRIVKLSGGRRRVLLSWKKLRGYTSYSVTRNGTSFRSTSARTMVDGSPPRGALRYRVTATS